MRPRDYAKTWPAPDCVRLAWAERYGMRESRSLWTDSFMCQMSQCKSDEARRLLVKAVFHQRRDERGTILARRQFDGKRPKKARSLEAFLAYLGKKPPEPAYIYWGPRFPVHDPQVERMMALAERLRA